MTKGRKVIIRQIRGTSGRIPQSLATLKALGLGRIGKERLHTLNPALIGMIKSVDHLVEIREAK